MVKPQPAFNHPKNAIYIQLEQSAKTPVTESHKTPPSRLYGLLHTETQ